MGLAAVDAWLYWLTTYLCLVVLAVLPYYVLCDGHGAMVRWCDGAMVRWCDGAMVTTFCAMVRWLLRTVRWCDGYYVLCDGHCAMDEALGRRCRVILSYCQLGTSTLRP